MQWRPLSQIFPRFIPAFTPRARHKWQLAPQRREFHFQDGKVTSADDGSEAEPDWSDEVDFDSDSTMASQELKQLQQLLGLVPMGKKPVKDAIFVCIDCEAFEHDQNKITEIGISVLDSRSVKDVDPGEDGKPWFELMKHIHLRPIEYKALVNRRFIKGCPDFFNFGKSDFIKLKEAGPIMDRIFSDPSRVYEACDLSTEIEDVSPSIMLVGHDLRNDTEYLRRLNFAPKHVDGQIDTQKLARISKAQPPGLTKLLAALSIKTQNLHNAGNDAAYTLQALVGVAVQEIREPGSVVRALRAEKAAKDAAKAAKKEGKASKALMAGAAQVAEADAAREAKGEKFARVHASHQANASQKSEVAAPKSPTSTNGPTKGHDGRPKVLPALGRHPTTRPEESRREHKFRMRAAHSKKGG